MKIKINPATQQPWFRPIATLCVVLTVLTSHPIIWAGVTTASISVQAEQAETPIAQNTQEQNPLPNSAGWRLLALESFATNGHPLITIQNANIDMKYVSNVILEGDRVLRFIIWNKDKVDEVMGFARAIDPRITMSIENGNLLVTFPEPISGPGVKKDYAVLCIIIIGGLGVGTYYGFRYLCKAAGLIPTNIPPPPPTNPPPPPPRTNRPPQKTNSRPAHVMSGGSVGSPLFTVESVDPYDERLYGVASFDASMCPSLYESSLYTDPAGNPFIRCLRSIVQSMATTTSGSSSGWQNRLTMYVWINDTYACFSIYAANGELVENVVVQKQQIGSAPPTFPPLIPIESLDDMVCIQDTNQCELFRSWSGIPSAP